MAYVLFYRIYDDPSVGPVGWPPLSVSWRGTSFSARVRGQERRTASARARASGMPSATSAFTVSCSCRQTASTRIPPRANDDVPPGSAGSTSRDSPWGTCATRSPATRGPPLVAHKRSVVPSGLPSIGSVSVESGGAKTLHLYDRVPHHTDCAQGVHRVCP
jgi:hypothetical protein